MKSQLNLDLHPQDSERNSRGTGEAYLSSPSQPTERAPSESDGRPIGRSGLLAGAARCYLRLRQRSAGKRCFAPLARSLVRPDTKVADRLR